MQINAAGITSISEKLNHKIIKQMLTSGPKTEALEKYTRQPETLK
jgi:hypothetical protein